MKELPWSGLDCGRMSGGEQLLLGVYGDSSENGVYCWTSTNEWRGHVAGLAEETVLGNGVTERLAAGIWEQEKYV